VTQRTLAKEVGINVSSINFCLKALVEKGWIKMGNIPGKFLTYMQSGLPVLANINAGNDLAGIIRHENVGRVSENGNTETLAKFALELIASVGIDAGYQARCRALYSRLFAPQSAVRQILTALEN